MSMNVDANERFEVISNPREVNYEDSFAKENDNSKRKPSLQVHDEESKRSDSHHSYHSMRDEIEDHNKTEMNQDEMELEALLMGDIDPPEPDEDSLLDEIGSNHHNQDDEEIKREGSNTFGRQLSGLKASRLKKNKLLKLQTIKRDASNGLSYTKMKERIQRTHPRKLVDGKLVRYPYWATNTGWHFWKKD